MDEEIEVDQEFVIREWLMYEKRRASCGCGGQCSPCRDDAEHQKGIEDRLGFTQKECAADAAEIMEDS